MSTLSRIQRLWLVNVLAFTLFAGVARYGNAPALLAFAAATVALGGLAWVVSLATEEVGAHLGPAATGVLQSTVGNLPELFVVVFALQAHELVVAQTAILGSIFSNGLLVLGLAIVVGSRRADDGVMRFGTALPRDASTLLLLTTFVIVLVSLPSFSGDAAAAHATAISVVGAVCLLVVYVGWVVPYIRGESRERAAAKAADGAPAGERAAAGGGAAAGERAAAEAAAGAEAGEAEAGEKGAGGAAAGERAAAEAAAGAEAGEKAAGGAAAGERAARPGAGMALSLSLPLLVLAGVGSAFVSDWFIHALQPSLTRLHLSQAFAGIVIVAIAGNAVEHAVGIVLASRGQSDLAISVIKNSVAQIAAFLFPVLVLISLVLTTTLTFSLAPVYVGALLLTVLAIRQITADGAASTFEGLALIGLYVVLAAVALYE